MEQITHYFEHMDYLSFGFIALPCVFIAIYGFQQVASGLAKGKNDNMQRYNSNNNNNNSGSGNNNNNKRCQQKYANGNMTTAAGQSTAATIANSYQQQQQQQQNNNNKSSRKTRYNNNKRQDGNAYKRTNAGNDSSWHRFVTSSCIEEKFLGQHHNPGHRNSTSSEATSEDINSCDEQSHKPNKCQRSNNNNNNGNGNCNNNNNNNNGKSRNKRQQKSKQSLNNNNNNNRTTAMVPIPIVASNEQANNKVNIVNGKCNKQQQQQQQQPQQQQQQQSNWRSNNKCNQKRANNNNNNNSSNNGKAKQNKCNNNNNRQNNNSNNINIMSNNTIRNNNNNMNNRNNNHTKCSSNSSSALSSPSSSPNSSSSGNSSSSSSSSSSGNSSIVSCHNNNHKSQHYNNKHNNNKNSHNNSNNNWRQNMNFLVPPLRQYQHFELDDNALLQQLRRHIIDHNLLRVYGYPVASVVHDGAIEIFKCLPHMSFAAAHNMSVTETALTVINCHDGLNTSLNYEENNTNSETLNETSPRSTSTDSGNISPRSLDSESGGEWSGSECESAPSATEESTYAAAGLQLYCNYATLMERSLAKECVRCKRDFLVDEHSGQYLTREECSYHWGKYHRCYDGLDNAWITRWTCCSLQDELAPGCTRNELHVWTGSVVGVNGPYHDFVQTRPRQQANANANVNPAVYALDCEMSYTGRGLDVTKVSLVALNGQLVYEHYVRPDADIVDYNTRYSGVTAKDLKSAGVKTLAEVQRDLLDLIDSDTILIGHGLDNDLRALRLVHHTLIDTSIAFPHSSGFPYRRALRHLTKTHLNREIQSGDGATGHSSFEDSRACMELMLWRVRCELEAECNWED